MRAKWVALSSDRLAAEGTAEPALQVALPAALLAHFELPPGEVPCTSSGKEPTWLATSLPAGNSQ